MEPITLVERARHGDATAFSHLVTQHWGFVYTICLSYIGHAAEAEDLTQEVFVRKSHDLVDLRAPDKFLPWLRQVTRNVCRMWSAKIVEPTMPRYGKPGCTCARILMDGQ